MMKANGNKDQRPPLANSQKVLSPFVSSGGLNKMGYSSLDKLGMTSPLSKTKILNQSNSGLDFKMRSKLNESIDH